MARLQAEALSNIFMINVTLLRECTVIHLSIQSQANSTVHVQVTPHSSSISQLIYSSLGSFVTRIELFTNADSATANVLLVDATVSSLERLV